MLKSILCNVNAYRSHSAISSSLSIEFALMHAIQGAIIVVAISLFQFISWLILRIRHADSLEIVEKGQFSIGFMLIWTAVVAFLSGLGKMLFPLSWTHGDVNNLLVLIAGTCGVSNAVIALIVIACIFSRKNWTLRMFVALFLIGICAWSEEYVIHLIFGSPGSDYWWIVFHGIQIAIFVGSLEVLRWSGWFRPVRKENGASPWCRLPLSPR